MKDYQEVAKRIMKMGRFCEIHNCGYPSEHIPVDLFFQLAEPCGKGYQFYVLYCHGAWEINYTLDNTIQTRAEMQSVGNIKTDREMYQKVEEIIHEIRSSCGGIVSGHTNMGVRRFL